MLGAPIRQDVITHSAGAFKIDETVVRVGREQADADLLTDGETAFAPHDPTLCRGCKEPDIGSLRRGARD